MPSFLSTNRRVLGAGILWLAWIWAVALVASRSTPWLTGPHNWAYDVERRATPLARWDSGWYVGIAESGYQAAPTRVGEETNHAFFPLFPLLMRAVARSTGIETSLAGNLISALALLGALVLLRRWVIHHYGPERAPPTILAFLFLPTSFFFATTYTESLLVFLALAAIVACEEDRPWLSMAAGFLSGLTRISGVVLAPYLFFSSLRASREAGVARGPALARAALLGASPIAGFGLFCLYFWRRFGDPLLFIRAQHNWAKGQKTIFDGPWLILQTILEDVTTGRVFHKSPARTLEGFFLLLFAFLAWRLFAEKRRPEALYVILTVLIVLASGTLESAGRYVLPAFPAFAILGSLSVRPWIWRPVLLLSALTQAVYVWIFVHWLWVG